jgi:hypothetical protein
MSESIVRVRVTEVARIGMIVIVAADVAWCYGAVAWGMFRVRF